MYVLSHSISLSLSLTFVLSLFLSLYFPFPLSLFLPLTITKNNTWYPVYIFRDNVPDPLQSLLDDVDVEGWLRLLLMRQIQNLEKKNLIENGLIKKWCKIYRYKKISYFMHFMNMTSNPCWGQEQDPNQNTDPGSLNYHCYSYTLVYPTLDLVKHPDPAKNLE